MNNLNVSIVCQFSSEWALYRGSLVATMETLTVHRLWSPQGRCHPKPGGWGQFASFKATTGTQKSQTSFFHTILILLDSYVPEDSTISSWRVRYLLGSWRSSIPGSDVKFKKRLIGLKFVFNKIINPLIYKSYNDSLNAGNGLTNIFPTIAKYSYVYRKKWMWSLLGKSFMFVFDSFIRLFI